MKTQHPKKIIEIFTAVQDQLCGLNPVHSEEMVNCYFRNNPDGTVRWVWPCKLDIPLFLKFYNTSSKRAKFFSLIIRLLFKLKLPFLFASGKLQLKCGLSSRDWSLFAGTAGVNQTAVFFADNFFYKVPIGSNAGNTLQNEFNNINQWKKYNFNHIELPSCSLSGTMLRQENVAEGGRQVAMLTGTHWKALAELAQLKTCNIFLGVLPEWKNLEPGLDALKQGNDGRIPKGLLRKLTLLKNSIDPQTIIPCSFAHGDFTPWNMFVKDDKISLIDWEMAMPCMPVFFDAFHFLYQQASLVDHAGYDVLKKRIDDAMQDPAAQHLIAKNGIDIQLHHKLYYLFTTMYYLQAYTLQPHWHSQVKMSMDMWNNAINDLIMTSNSYSPRQVLISDTFDYLRPKKLCSLKMAMRRSCGTFRRIRY